MIGRNQRFWYYSFKIYNCKKYYQPVEKEKIVNLVKEILTKDSRLAFAYVYGSFVRHPKLKGRSKTIASQALVFSDVRSVDPSLIVKISP